MRQVTATEKYRAVNEGKMAKGEFVRQMRMAYPSVISQWNSYNDTVTILKNRGYITEKTGVDTYDSRHDLNISSESIDRGVRYELAAQGQDPATVTDKELVAKVTDRVVKNLKKDPLHYINLLAKESSHVDKNDKMKETKRGAQETDTFNGMKKADLKENTDINSAKENIIKVASVIRAKYAEIPGFNSILKDFLQTHQDDIKAGNVTDPIAEFNDYIDLNYDSLDEKYDREEEDGHLGTNTDDDFEREQLAQLAQREGKGKDHDGDGDIDSDDYMMAKDKAIKKAMGKDEVVSEMSPEMADVIAFLATGAGIQGASHVAGKLLKALESGRFGEKGKEIAQDIHNLAKPEVEEKTSIDLKESVKNIITKVLEEQMINEAATNELARLAEDYAEFPGMKQSIIALQDIVTDIESFYDKTREKIQKVYDSIGEIRNEEGLKVGGFIAPTIEAAFNKDLRPVTKVGFTGGLETPKVKTLSQSDIDRVNAGGELEEEPKQNVFAPISESKKKK